MDGELKQCKGRGKPNSKTGIYYNCEEWKPLSEFHKRSTKKDGHSDACKVCFEAYQRDLYNKRIKEEPGYKEKHRADGRRFQDGPKGKPHRRDRHLKNRYNLTSEEYEDLLEKQGRVCAISGQVEENDKPLSVDHDHNDGHIRGLVRNRYNMMLALAYDDPEILEAGAAYLRRTKITSDI